MLSAKLFNATTVFYMLSMLAFFGYMAGRNRVVGLAGSGLIIACTQESRILRYLLL